MNYADKMNKVFAEKRIQRKCPVCQYPELDVINDMYHVSLVSPITNDIMQNEGLLLLPVVCKNCQFVLWFNHSIVD